jgi:ubiquinol-cytochrome c reductase cytochrome c subunit
VTLRRALTVVLAAGAVASAPSAAYAGSPPPIVRPANEAASPQELGRQIFAGNCSTCHGSIGQGVAGPVPQGGSTVSKGLGPPLIGVGRQATDFYLRTGYMPLGDPHDQPERHRPELTDREIRAVETYVDSLGSAPGPPIPRPDPAAGDIADGQQLFTEHCAGCHQAVGEGGVATGARVPPLDEATAVQIAQAVRIGPYVMPTFSKQDISDDELNSIVRYVQYTQNPDDRGGLGIGHLGPFPEGMVTGFVVLILFVLVCRLIGERVKRA